MEEAAARRSKRRREVLAAALGLVAVVLIWRRAIWDMAAAVMSPLTSLVVGLALIGVIGYLNKDYLKELF